MMNTTMIDSKKEMTTKVVIKGKTNIQSRKYTKIENLLLKIAVHFFGVLPALVLLIQWKTNQLTVNPIQFVEQRLGLASINLLLVSLGITPFITLTGWKQPGRHRRAVGLYTFLYVALHFLTFVLLDFGFDVQKIIFQTIQKPFIIIGVLAAIILLALAATSFKYWMKKLGKTWKKLHQAVYVAACLAVIHYALALKGSVTTLSGDVIRPIIFGVIVSIMLLLRISPIKNWVIRTRKQIF